MSVRGFLPPPMPTAQSPPPGIAVMPAIPLSPLPGLGLGVSDQLALTPCSIRVWWSPLASMYQPPAQVEPSAAVVAENRSCSPRPLFGEVTSEPPAATRVVNGVTSVSRAPTSVAPVRPNGSRLSVGSDGVETECQDEPFHCSRSAELGKL